MGVQMHSSMFELGENWSSSDEVPPKHSRLDLRSPTIHSQSHGTVLDGLQENLIVFLFF